MVQGHARRTWIRIAAAVTVAALVAAAASACGSDEKATDERGSSPYLDALLADPMAEAELEGFKVGRESIRAGKTSDEDPMGKGSPAGITRDLELISPDRQAALKGVRRLAKSSGWTVVGSDDNGIHCEKSVAVEGHGLVTATLGLHLMPADYDLGEIWAFTMRLGQ